MRGCAHSSITSASNTSFCPQPSAMPRAGSTPRCCGCSSTSTRSWRSCCRRCARSAQTYSPFLPISPRTGIVLQVPILEHDARAGTITYEDPENKERVTTLVTGGRAKLQWKPDWAMRWVALGVDYEMAGKDLIDSVRLSGEVCRALGGTPPE